MTAQPQSPVGEPAPPAPVAAEHRAPRRRPTGRPARGTLLLGLLGSVLVVVGGVGAGGVLVHDPLLSDSPLGFWRYGHGRELATAAVYAGVALLVWSWVRLGRGVLARRVGGRGVLLAAAAWTAPMLVAPPLFTRDVFSYLAQGTLPLAGYDPYANGPEVLPAGVLRENVHFFWLDTPAPYGPLFILLAKGMAAVFAASGENIVLGVLGMRLLMLPGLALLVWALPGLARRLGGRVPVALWVAVANPVTIVHLVGGGHNDLLVVGMLAAGALLALRGRPAAGVAVVSGAMAIKATAGLALPFLVLVWAAQLPGARSARLAKAIAAGLGVFGAVFGALTVAAGVGLGWLPALAAPSMIVNWLSVPTAAGELALHTVAALAVSDVPAEPYIETARVLGMLALLAIAGWQWFAARDGGPETVRRAGVVLLAAALLAPTTLPWYLSWGMALLAAAPWSVRGLQVVVFGSVWLMCVYYPDGETALYDWRFLAVCALLGVLAATSLARPDPLGMRADPPAPPVRAGSGAEPGRG